jgi:uncharacterized protein YcbX
MLGEELESADITKSGLLGDRAYALIDGSDGKVATAKNPRKWPTLFNFHAELAATPAPGAKLPPVRITLPDGAVVTSEQPDVHRLLSSVLGRDVTLSGLPEQPMSTAEEFWPDMEGLDHRNTVTDFNLPESTYFDIDYVHILTTATLARFRELYPEGRFEVPRFRPNIVVDTGASEAAFEENAWIGKTLAIGDNVRLSITGPCGRCVMTTLPQGDLPRDMGILRTAAQRNRGSVGVYAAVLQAGQIRRGDSVSLE